MPEPTYSAAHTGYKTHSSCDTCGVTMADTARELHTAWHQSLATNDDVQAAYQRGWEAGTRDPWTLELARRDGAATAAAATPSGGPS